MRASRRSLSVPEASLKFRYRHLDEWVHDLLATLHRTGATRVAIDSLGDLRAACRDELRFREYVYSLLQRCARDNISVIMTQEVPDLFGVAAGGGWCDPEGVAWIRTLLRSLAAEGRTVFVSSHLMSEMAVTADHLIVIGRGRLLADTSVAQFVRSSSAGHVQVRTPQPERLAALLREHGATVDAAGDGDLAVTGMEAATVGELSTGNGIVLHELVARQPSLEEAPSTAHACPQDSRHGVKVRERSAVRFDRIVQL